MNRLQKFIEQGAFGEAPGRTAYAINPSKLPAPKRGLEWRPVDGFQPGEAILSDPGLKRVFEEALRQGYAVVAPT
jgi:hypothetical protein